MAFPQGGMDLGDREMSALGQKRTSAVSERCPLHPQKRTSSAGYVWRSSSGSLAMLTAILRIENPGCAAALGLSTNQL
jgi:hypothetical protein